jgi:TRAP-type C4-dicarboxylate transport system permease small subunit
VRQNAVLNILGHILDRIVNGMFAFAGFLLLFAMIIISIGVASRYLLDRPIGWAIEIVEYSLLYIAFLTAPLVLKRGAHVRMDLIFSRLSPSVQSVLELVTSCVSTIVCLILFWFGLRVTRELFRTGYTTPTVLEVPKFLVIGIIFIGFGVLFVLFLVRTYNLFESRKASGREKEGSDKQRH